MAVHDLHARLDFTQRLIDEAATEALGYFARRRGLALTSKGVQDMASEADLSLERLIRERLMSRFPDDAFLGEESGYLDARAGTGMWVVDPIDGTQPFVCGLPSWCISIAYVHAGHVEMGFVTAPVLGESYAGVRGQGATLNGAAIRVGEASRLDDGILGVGYSPRVGADDIVPLFDRLLREGVMFYRDGSGTLDLCYVACGRLIGYVEPHIQAWDALAAVAIIEAAGGVVTDMLVDDTLRTGGPIVATTPGLYPVLDALTRASWAGRPT